LFKKRQEERAAFQSVEAGFPETVAQGFLVAAKGIDVGSQKDAVVGRTVPEAENASTPIVISSAITARDPPRF
jgi:hypothetical protein